MKRKLFVPIMRGLMEKYFEDYLRDLKRIDADAVFYACGFPYDEGEQEEICAELQRMLPRLEKAGYPTGVWINGFGFGSPLTDGQKSRFPYTRITSPTGKVTDSAFCPTDGAFTAYYCSFVQNLIRAGAKRIMIDDDLCLNIRPGLGCACDEHLRRFRAEVGEEIDRDEIFDLVFTGEASRYRRAWIKVMGDSMKDFCRAVRRAADEIDGTVELGFCSGYTSWDGEGADALELTGILAGKNAPFLRYSCAPYWNYTGRFPWEPEGHIVEFCRQQIRWCNDREIELFTENDTYPRPRANVPAFAAESFDFMTAADSGPHQLKYLFDYVSSPAYERGYLDAHLKNRDQIGDVARILGPMPSAGVYVHDPMRKFEDMTLPTPFCGEKQILRTVSFSAAASLLAANGIPVTYDDHGGVTAAFGDGGRTVDLDRKAYIIDLPAAEELQKRGMDVGLISMAPAERGGTEYFVKADDSVRIEDRCREGFVKALLSPAATVESGFAPDMPSSYRYRNEAGAEFLVFLFRADFISHVHEIASSYYRQAQIADFCREAGHLPIFCPKHPGLYLICKETKDALAVAYCNYSDDPIENPLFETAVPLGDGITLGCEGKSEEGGFRLTGIPARSFGAFWCVKK